MKTSCIPLVVALGLLGMGQADPVRSLKVKDPERALPAGGSEAIVFADTAAVRKGLEERIQCVFKGAYVKATDAERKAIAERMAKALEDQVDFAKQSIVWVRWQTGGPPDGTLQRELKDSAVVFFVQAPPAGGRGDRATSHNDFFAIPARFTATLEPHERPPK